MRIFFLSRWNDIWPMNENIVDETAMRKMSGLLFYVPQKAALRITNSIRRMSMGMSEQMSLSHFTNKIVVRWSGCIVCAYVCVCLPS